MLRLCHLVLKDPSGGKSDVDTLWYCLAQSSKPPCSIVCSFLTTKLYRLHYGRGRERIKAYLMRVQLNSISRAQRKFTIDYSSFNGGLFGFLPTKPCNS